MYLEKESLVILIRRAQIEDAREIATIHTQVWKIWYKNIIHQEFLDSMKEDHRLAKWNQFLTEQINEHFVAVENGQKIVGFITGGKDRENHAQYTCEILALYLLPEYHNRGIGKLLFQKAIEALKQKGHTTMRVFVLENNPSCAFYQKIGGVLMGSKEVKFGDKPYKEIWYGYQI